MTCKAARAAWRRQPSSSVGSWSFQCQSRAQATSARIRTSALRPPLRHRGLPSRWLQRCPLSCRLRQVRRAGCGSQALRERLDSAGGGTRSGRVERMAVVTGKPGGPFPSVPDAQGYPYTERIRPPKYNREMKLSSLDASNQRRYAPRYFTDWDQDDHLYAAVQQLERAAKLEEKHFHTAMKAVERYGGQGALIAGGLRDHWPESVK